MSLDFELVQDAGRDLKSIERIVLSCAFDAVEDDWSEVERTFEGDEAYVSFLLSSDPGDVSPSLRIEIGVLDETSRHPTAGLKAQWSREDGAMAQVQSIIVDGRECSPERFKRRMARALSLAGAPACI